MQCSRVTINFYFCCSRNLNTRWAIQFTRADLRRKTTIQRKINPSDCNFKQIGNQNLILNWGIFAENFPEEILQDLHKTHANEAFVNIRRSHLYKEKISYSTVRMGLGHQLSHLVDFHDVPDSMLHLFFIMGKNVRKFLWRRSTKMSEKDTQKVQNVRNFNNLLKHTLISVSFSDFFLSNFGLLTRCCEKN